MAGPVTVPGASGTTVTISGGNGDALLLAKQIGLLLSTVQGVGNLSVTTDTDSGPIPAAPQVDSDEPTGTAADVYRLYQGMFNRDPDAGGLSAWTAMINSGQLSLAQVAEAMTTTAEFTQGPGALSNAAYVAQLYQNMFGRNPEGNTGQGWAAILAGGASRGSVAMSIAESAEAKSGAHPTVEQKNDAEIYRLYQAAFHRSADQGGETFWSSMLGNGGTVEQLVAGIVDSAEFQSDMASLGNADYIAALYSRALGRQPDQGGAAAWLAAMNAGMSRADVLRAFADSLESRAKWAPFADDDKALTNELLLNGPGGLNQSVPGGYSYIVVNDAGSDTLSASNAVIVTNAAGGTFFLSGTSTLAAAGGNNIVTASGDYELSFGDGNNLIDVSGSGLVSTGLNGASTVFAGGAANTIQSNGTGDVVDALFGNTSVNEAGSSSQVTGVSGNLTVTITGTNDSVIGVGAATTVDATGANAFVQGGPGPLDFVGGAGGATIIGGTGGSTVFGAAGSNITFNGSGDLAYTASVGSATLNAAGSTGNVNASMAGGNDSIIAGGGAETLDGGAGLNTFLFDNNNTQGNAIDITDSAAQMANDTFNFTNYGGINPVVTSGAGQPVVLQLSDNTTITFTNVTDPLLIQTHNI